MIVSTNFQENIPYCCPVPQITIKLYELALLFVDYLLIWTFSVVGEEYVHIAQGMTRPWVFIFPFERAGYFSKLHELVIQFVILSIRFCKCGEDTAKVAT